MDLSEAAQEILEVLWTKLVESEAESVTLADIEQTTESPAILELQERGLIRIADGRVRLTPEGEEESRQAIRRHRLAERLLADVLETKRQILEEDACRFEHLLYPGMEETICKLLGHPQRCPHGLPIPPGECCKQHARGERLVSSLVDMRPGEGGRIAYLQSQESKELQKLMAMGVLPGSPIRLIRCFPSFVFETGHTQYAVDREIAAAIYVRLEPTESASPASDAASPPRHRHRWRFRWGRRSRDA